MKRILSLILVVGMTTVSFGQSDISNKKYLKHEISEAINDIEDEIEWMKWDIEEGKIDKKTGELYINNFMRTRNRLFIVYKSLLEE